MKIRVVLQRVKEGGVKVENKIVSSIGKGLVVLAAFKDSDNNEIIEYVLKKIINLRIFDDENNKLNLSLLDVKGQLLLVPQFTLYGDCRKGRRPGYSEAAGTEIGKELFEISKKICRNLLGDKSEFGIFQASMEVKIINDGPVTLILEKD